MTDEQSFIRAILANPDDDAPRLIYSDWLDEQGRGEQAEFIRVQCELAKHPQQVEWLRQMPLESWRGSKEEGELLQRLEPLRLLEKELLCGPVARALVPDHLPFILVLSEDHGIPNPRRLLVRRGFGHHVFCSWDDCREYLDEILKCHPVQEVMLTMWPQEIPCGEQLSFTINPLIDYAAKPFLAKRWPKIKPEKWHLPDRYGVPPLRDAYHAWQYGQAMRDDIVRRLT